MKKNRSLNVHDLPPTLTVGEVAELLNLGSGTVYKMVREGEIVVIRFGRKILVPTVPLLKKLGDPGASIEVKPPRHFEEGEMKASLQPKGLDEDARSVGRGVSLKLPAQHEPGSGGHQSNGEETQSALEKKAVEVLEKLDPDFGVAPLVCKKRSTE